MLRIFSQLITALLLPVESWSQIRLMLRMSRLAGRVTEREVFGRYGSGDLQLKIEVYDFEFQFAIYPIILIDTRPKLLFGSPAWTVSEQYNLLSKPPSQRLQLSLARYPHALTSRFQRQCASTRIYRIFKWDFVLEHLIQLFQRSSPGLRYADSSK
jgi:hypothetical protein